jgi:chemotaxis regulatin CheY-phosphate phosphatase CheZ
LSDADYEAIEGAVMETARGRWFLAEYARRNRNADTNMLLKALDRIEAAMRGESSVEPVDRIRFDLVEMSKAIARTKTEIAAMKPDADHHGKFGEASEELDSVVQQTEAATSDILACAERIQEMAWTLREQGLDAAACDLLDANATEVYTACSFQDLTGQRTRKVIGVLRYLEGRINAMIDIWGLDGAMSAEAAETRAVETGKALLNGPARPGHGLDQADVDMVMGPAAVSRDVQEIAPPLQPAEETVVEIAVAEEVSASAHEEAAEDEIADEEWEELRRPAMRAAPANDPLEPFMALSAEEKIALFT